jgi:exosome complex component RRP4
MYNKTETEKNFEENSFEENDRVSSGSESNSASISESNAKSGAKYNSDSVSEVVDKLEEKKERKIVLPGDVLVSGMNFLPGDNTARKGKDIISLRYGLEEQNDRLVKVIPLSGAYAARRGNIIIGKVTDINSGGWIIDINSPYSAFLPAKESGRFINRNELSGFLNFQDMVVAEVFSISPREVDLTLRKPGLGLLIDGIIVNISPSKVPRVIGKEGSMVNLIKQETNCNIKVGQNGLIWIKGEKVGDELLAKEVIMFISEKSFVPGLTEKVKDFLEQKKKSGGKK